MHNSTSPVRRLRGLFLALVVGSVQLLGWWAVYWPAEAPETLQWVRGLAYTGFDRWQAPDRGDIPRADRVARDLDILRGVTGEIRTYSASEVPSLPALAQRDGLKVTLGLWLDEREDFWAREVEALRGMEHEPAVRRLIVGNETQLLNKVSEERLLEAIREVRTVSSLPVSTAEPWHVWLSSPRLADSVDFLTVHLLPYWEGVPAERAVDIALARLGQVREAFPGKPIVIGEVGWPSGGDPRQAAIPGLVEQASFVRDWVDRIHQLAVTRGEGVDYFLMEAIDQPWKVDLEGPVGAHWGLLDAYRNPKFSFRGPVEEDTHWLWRAGISSLLGMLLGAALLARMPRLRWQGQLLVSVGVQLLVASGVLLLSLPLINYLSPWEWAVLVGLLPPLLILWAMLMAQLVEFSELYWPGALPPSPRPERLGQEQPRPFVSLHMAVCREDPAMVIAGIETVLRLDWPRLELLVIDNNTPDETLWRPIHEFAARRGDPRLRVIRLENWPGYKAGALNVALRETHPEAEWVGLLDADYRVSAGWLEDVSAHLADPKLVLVQGPQAHRLQTDPSDGTGAPAAWPSVLEQMMDDEFSSFFRLGMHHRQARNAALQHGTLCLMRREALAGQGGWAEDCVCEDSELGLRLLATGREARYVDHPFGTGVLPDDFPAYAQQRRRWAEGAAQILVRHAGLLWRGRSAAGRLTRAQRLHFVAGWLPWLGDSLHLFFTVAASLWTVAFLIWPEAIGLPISLFWLPLLVFLFTRLMLGPILMVSRMKSGWRRSLMAAWAGMALSTSIARGFLWGLMGGRHVFRITPKAGATRPAGESLSAEAIRRSRHLRAIQPDLGLALLLVISIGLTLTVIGQGIQPDFRLWAWVGLLIALLLPYAAAISLASLSAWAPTYGALGQPRQSDAS